MSKIPNRKNMQPKYITIRMLEATANKNRKLIEQMAEEIAFLKQEINNIKIIIEKKPRRGKAKQSIEPLPKDALDRIDKKAKLLEEENVQT